MPSKRLETATKFVDHYATHDNEVLKTLLTDDLTFDFSPSRSLDNAKSLDKAGYMEFKRGMKLVQTGYPLDVKKYIEGESANTVVVWCTGSPQWREELKDYEVFSEEQWEYVGEFIFMLTMDEEGEKITKILEFVDSKGTDNKLLPLAQRALGNLQKLQQASGNYI